MSNITSKKLRRFFPRQVSSNDILRKYIRRAKLRITDERTMAYDSPTGRAYIGVAKKPLQVITNGYGFKGILIQTDNREFIQCHECGKWFRQITRLHLDKHNMNHEEYREKYGLNPSTALISDGCSQIREEHGSKNIRDYNAATSDDEKNRIALKAKAIQMATTAERRKRLQKATSVEHDNKYGLCEQQIGFRLVEYIKKYKNLPSGTAKGAGNSLAKGIKIRYGSLNEGFKHYGVPMWHRKGTNIEMIAQDGAQLFYNVVRGIDRNEVLSWMMEHSPVLQGNVNVFAQKDL